MRAGDQAAGRGERHDKSKLNDSCATTAATDVTDLLALTAELVDIPSVSHDEQAITDHIEPSCAALPWLAVDRVGDNLVARTELGRSTRLVLAGHTDTVPVERQRAGHARGRHAVRPRLLPT